MMVTIETVARRVGVDESRIMRWVELAWVHAEGEPGQLLFHEAEAARAKLIGELSALSLDEEAMPVVLSLLDQLHAARRQMRLIQRAIDEAAPETVRARLVVLMNDAGLFA